MPAPRLLLVGLLSCGLALTACSAGDSRDRARAAQQEQVDRDCDAAVEQVLLLTEEYLAQVAETGPRQPGGAPSSSPSPGAPEPQDAEQERDVQAALQDVRGYAAGLGCDREDFSSAVAAGLDELSAGGPVAGAVLAQLRVEAEPARNRSGPSTGPELVEAVAAARDGAVLELPAGVLELPDTLVLLRGVTLRGAGRGSTVLTSAAPDGTVLVLTSAPVSLTDLTVRRSGASPGNAVVGAPASTLSLARVDVSGARAAADGQGGTGVLMAAGRPAQDGVSRRPTLVLDDVRVTDHAVAGVVVGGDNRAEVRGGSVDAAGQCGVCFLDVSDGVVTGTSVSGTQAAVAVTGSARPLLRDLVLSGGQVGVQATDSAAPRIEGGTVSGAAQAGLLFTGTATGSVDGVECEGLPAGIVVGPQALPGLGENGCEVVRGSA